MIVSIFKRVCLPPIVKSAEIINSMPIDKYKSRFNESLINNAPLNKSA